MRALLLAALVALPAFAVEPEPEARLLPDGSILFSKDGATKLDEELKRLQGVERQHKAEQWAPVVLISVGIGVLIGAAAVVVPVAVLSSPGS